MKTLAMILTFALAWTDLAHGADPFKAKPDPFKVAPVVKAGCSCGCACTVCPSVGCDCGCPCGAVSYWRDPADGFTYQFKGGKPTGYATDDAGQRYRWIKGECQVIHCNGNSCRWVNADSIQATPAVRVKASCGAGG